MLSVTEEKGATEEPAKASREDVSAYWSCPSCGRQASGGFCQNCGEKRSTAHDLSVVHFLSHAGELFFHWDSKIFRSLRLLLTRPGYLAVEYVRGCRKPYIHPFQMFFIANLLYFLLFPVIGWTGLKTPMNVYRNRFSYSDWASRMADHRAAAKGMRATEFAHAFDHVIDVQSRSLVLVMVPIFAFVVFFLEWRKHRFYGEHLAFSFYFYAFWLIASLMVVPFAGSCVILATNRLGGHLSDRTMDRWMSLVGLAFIASYLFISLRRFYGDGIFLAVVKAGLLSMATYYILQFYRLVLFVTALYST